MSSFKRKASTKQVPLFPGTRASPSSTSTIITSTGIPSFDDILGGGLPLSCTSITLAPDPHSAYGVLLQKYFVSQGIAWGHCVCVVDDDAEDFLQECSWTPNTNGSPDTASLDDGDEDITEQQDTNDKIKIAWRYKQMKQFTTTVSASSAGSEQFCRTIDLSYKLPEAVVEKARRDGILSFVRVDSADSTERSTTRVIGQLSLLLRKNLPSPGSGVPIRPLRIVIPALASPQWGGLTSEDILLFLHSLRALMRQHPFACVSSCISPHVSTDTWGGAGWIQKIGWLSDAAITLSAFTAIPSLSATFPSHHGLLHIHTLPAPHTLLPPSDKFSMLRGLSPSAVSAGGGSGENNLAFKCTRKRFIFETLHLDVEGGVGERRTTPSSNAMALDAGTIARQGGPESEEKTAPIPSTSIAAVQVELETGAIPAAEALPEVKTLSATSEKPKKPKKKVAFHSDRPDLYDF